MTIDLIYYGLMLVFTLGSIILAIVKGKGGTKKSKLIKLANILQNIPELVIEAESLFPGKTGAQKITYVLKELEIECVKQKLEFDREYFVEKIEEILSTPTKKENGYEETSNI